MFAYLEKIFGKSIQRFEALMRSKSEKNTITAQQVDQAMVLLKSLKVPAKSITSTQNLNQTEPYSSLREWPLNSKKIKLPFYGVIKTPTHDVNLFVLEEKLEKDDSNFYADVLLPNQKVTLLKATETGLLQNKSWVYHEISSLPIWEEVIHRDLIIHKKLVAIAPENPWTLYKMAKAKLTDTAVSDLVGGFPQWIVNNQDYRKLKGSTFLFQITLSSNRLIYFVFIKDGEIITISQR